MTPEMKKDEFSSKGSLESTKPRPHDLPAETLPKVPAIVILTHGKSGEELVKSAEMIIGKIDRTYTFSLMPGEDPAEYVRAVSSALEHVPCGSLVMVDLFGGTPSNCAALLSREHSIAAVSGVNLPMLIEAASLRKSFEGKELAKKVIASAKDGIKDIVKMLGGE